MSKVAGRKTGRLLKGRQTLGKDDGAVFEIGLSEVILLSLNYVANFIDGEFTSHPVNHF